MICDRCGREQPCLHSPCPQCPQIGSAFSIPPLRAATDGQQQSARPPERGGKVELMSPGLRMAFAHAHRLWAARYAPHLLREWENA